MITRMVKATNQTRLPMRCLLFQSALIQNPKSEARNPKQTLSQNSNI
jgi:hypothetical protein